MTGVLVGGALAGLGVLMLSVVLLPPRVQPGAALARLDLERAQLRTRGVSGIQDRDGLRAGLGRHLVRVLNDLGIDLGRTRSDLALLGRTPESFLATVVLAAVGAFLAPMVVFAVLVVLGVRSQPTVPLLAAVLLALAAAAVPVVGMRARATDARRDLRHVVGSFLDLVAMSLAGGRGVPEALQSASELSDGWGMVRIRNALVGARLRGETPWSALGRLGEELRLTELRDLAAALALVAEDGAKVRDSLTARADSMRRRELAESEGKAGEKSQSMLVAQLLLCVGFLVFLMYPAMVNVLGAL